jgi:hypothetical protein
MTNRIDHDVYCSCYRRTWDRHLIVVVKKCQQPGAVGTVSRAVVSQLNASPLRAIPKHSGFTSSLGL